MTRTVLGAALWVLLSADGADHCQPPPEPEEREVKVVLRAGGLANQRLDEEFERLKKISTIRPSLPQDLAQGGYSELMQEMMASWGDFMDYQPERDDRFEEGDRKSRGKFTWKTRLRQLNNIVQYGIQKEEIMGMYAGHELYPAVVGTYWLRKVDFEALSLSSQEAALFSTIWQIAGPRRLIRPIRRCQDTSPCACHFVACGPSASAAERGQLEALELRSGHFEWPEFALEGTPIAAGVKYLALEGRGAFSHPQFWLHALPGIKVLQLAVSSSMQIAQIISNVSVLLEGWQHVLLGLSLHWNSQEKDTHMEAPEAPSELLESICVLKNLRRLHLDGYISRLPGCLGQLPLVELDVRGLQFRDALAVPPALASLGRTLVSFIGYSQGLDRSCNRSPPWNRSDPEFLTRCRPRPSWDAAQPIDADDEADEAWAWQCPWESWLVKLDDSEAPWWAWHRMERFWVDANFFHGSFPAKLVESWPRMRSLDLQLNEISGPLPGEALSKLQNLTALRIHRNNFSGPVPGAIFEAPSLSYTNFEGNSELTGCIPVMPEDEETWHSLEVAIQGTKIAGLCEGQNSKDSKNGKKRTEL